MLLFQRMFLATLIFFFPDVREAVVFQKEVFLLFEDRVQRLELTAVGKLISKLFHAESYILCAKVATAFHTTVAKRSSRPYVSTAMIAELKEQVQKENETELLESLDNLHKCMPEDDDTTHSVAEPSFDKLESGIYMMRQRSLSEVITDAEDEQCSRKIQDESSHETRDAATVEPIEINPEPTIDIETPKTDTEETMKNDSKEESLCTDVQKLPRRESSESLLSFTSLSSNELVFGSPAFGEHTDKNVSFLVRFHAGRCEIAILISFSFLRQTLNQFLPSGQSQHPREEERKRKWSTLTWEETHIQVRIFHCFSPNKSFPRNVKDVFRSNVPVSKSMLSVLLLQ